jgi:hypothetical protein
VPIESGQSPFPIIAPECKNLDTRIHPVSWNRLDPVMQARMQKDEIHLTGRAKSAVDSRWDCA